MPMLPNKRLHSTVNKGTGEIISIPATAPEEALITTYILKEENGNQLHRPSWYRKEMVVIDLSQNLDLLVLGNWSITVEKRK